MWEFSFRWAVFGEVFVDKPSLWYSQPCPWYHQTGHLQSLHFGARRDLWPSGQSHSRRPESSEILGTRVAKVVQGKSILLFQKLLLDNNYDDMEVVSFLSKGVDLTGSHPFPAYADSKVVPATSTREQLLRESLWRRKSLVSQTPSEDDFRKLEEQTLKLRSMTPGLLGLWTYQRPISNLQFRMIADPLQRWERRWKMPCGRSCWLCFHLCLWLPCGCWFQKMSDLNSAHTKLHVWMQWMWGRWWGLCPVWAPLRATCAMSFWRFALSGRSQFDSRNDEDLIKSFKWISAMLVLSCLQEDRTAWFHVVQRQDLHWFSKRNFGSRW